jgi:hypothetical protein
LEREKKKERERKRGMGVRGEKQEEVINAEIMFQFVRIITAKKKT